MHAIRFHEYGTPEVLRFEEVPEPSAAAGEVLVDVRAIAVSPINWKVALAPGLVRSSLPMIPGAECAGTTPDGSRVVLIGGGYGTARAGTYAEKISAHPDHLVPIPDGVPFDVAASLGIASCTAFLALERAGLAAGDKVVILGATGGVGLAALQLARLRGASQVIAVARPDAHEALRGLGADLVLDVDREDLGPSILAATGGGADLILDPLAGAVGSRALGALREHGRHVVLGTAAGESLSFPVTPFYRKTASVLGFAQFMVQDRLAATARTLLADVAAGRLVVPIDRSFPLAQAADAWRYAQQRGKLGKFMLVP